MFFSALARKGALINIAFSIAIFLCLLFSIPLHAAVLDWNKLSDEQIARLFFPEGKLGLGDNTKGLVDESGEIDGVLVYEVKRVIANFDNDPEMEMAVLIVYSASYNYAEYTEAIFAILDIENEQIKIRWRTEGSVNAPVDISAMKLIKKDKFSALSCTYDSVGAARGSSYQKMKIIRWDGKRFAEIWSYDMESYDGGNRGGIPHDYSAKVDFVDDEKGDKRIKVTATYATRPHMEEQKLYTLYEEFVWSPKNQRYWVVRQHEHKYEKDQACLSIKEHAQEDERHCYNVIAIERRRAYIRGLVYWQKGQYDQAISDFSEALKINISLPDAYFYRGAAYLQKELYDEAISDLTIALRTKHAPRIMKHRYDMDSYSYRALANMRKGQYDQAISDYTKALEMKPGLTGAYQHRGLAYLEKGEYDQAVSDFNKALETNPKDIEVYFYKAQAYEQAGRTSEAIEAYRTYIQNVSFSLAPLIERAAKKIAELER